MGWYGAWNSGVIRRTRVTTNIEHKKQQKQQCSVWRDRVSVSIPNACESVQRKLYANFITQSFKVQRVILSRVIRLSRIESAFYYVAINLSWKSIHFYRLTHRLSFKRQFSNNQISKNSTRLPFIAAKTLNQVLGTFKGQ